MIFTERLGVTLVDSKTQREIDWISDLIVKALCGACTILLAVAVSSLQSMNAEIKELSTNVYELSSNTKVMTVTMDSLKEKIHKLEKDVEALQRAR